jgi:integrase
LAISTSQTYNTVEVTMASRRAQFGTTRIMPSGKVQARYVHHGERSTLGYYSTEKLARAALAGEWDSINRGTHRDRRKGQIKFRDFVVEMHDLRTADLSPRHVANVESILRKWLLPEFGGRKLNDIDPEAIDRWMAQLSKKTGPVNRRNLFYGLRGWLALAKKYDYLAENPCQTGGAGRDVSKERPFLDKADFDRIVAATEPWMATVLRLTFGAHLRLSELCGLNRGDIDLKTMTVLVERQAQQTPGGLQIRATKTSNSKTIRLLSLAHKDAEALLKASIGPKDAPLLTGAKGGRINAGVIHREWVKITAELGLEDYHFHDIRATSLTMVARGGATTRDLMERAGHRSSAASLRYQKSNSQRDAEVATATDKLMATG